MVDRNTEFETYKGSVQYLEIGKYYALHKELGSKPSEILKLLHEKYGQLHIVDLALHFTDAYKLEETIPVIQLLDCLLADKTSGMTYDEFDTEFLNLVKRL